MTRKPATTISPRLRKFADEYLICGVAKTAWIKAGYSKGGASTEASKALRNPLVQEYLAKKQSKIADRAAGLQERILDELERLAFSNVEDFTKLDKDGSRVIDFSRATREQLSAITKISTKKRTHYHKGQVVGEELNASFNLAVKERSLELLGRHIGMFKQDEQRVVVDVADRLLAARRRVAALSGPAETGEGTEGEE